MDLSVLSKTDHLNREEIDTTAAKNRNSYLNKYLGSKKKKKKKNDSITTNCTLFLFCDCLFWPWPLNYTANALDFHDKR